MRAHRGLSEKLEQFFADHPNGELTYKQIAERFFVSLHHARTTVSNLRDSDEYESVHVIRRKVAKP
jgi:hypothetical protein